MLIALAPRTRDFEERLWEKIDRRGPNECWPWTGGSRSSYGTILGWRGRTRVIAHRAVFFSTHGISNTAVIRHTCDNPNCCNPAHLLAGTQKDNVQDMMERGRARASSLPRNKGSKNGYSKLTEQQARSILDDYHPSHVIAAEYGVAPSTVSAVKIRRTWKHVSQVPPQSTRKEREC
jgi:hypothetical protein